MGKIIGIDLGTTNSCVAIMWGEVGGWIPTSLLLIKRRFRCVMFSFYYNFLMNVLAAIHSLYE